MIKVLLQYHEDGQLNWQLNHTLFISYMYILSCRDKLKEMVHNISSSYFSPQPPSEVG